MNGDCEPMTNETSGTNDFDKTAEKIIEERKRESPVVRAKYNLLRRGTMQLAKVCSAMEGASLEQVNLLADATGFNAINPVRREPKVLRERIKKATEEFTDETKLRDAILGILDEIPEAS